jgi:long-subunit fatty acid transport protein
MRAQTAPGFRDTLVPRAAAEWSPGDRITLRGGYAFVPTPAAALLEDRALIDNHRHVVTGGAGFAVGGAAPMRLDVWIQHHRLVERDYPMVGERPAFVSSGSIAAIGVGVEVELE